jgi:Ni/Co efflux regulator RcnB
MNTMKTLAAALAAATFGIAGNATAVTGDQDVPRMSTPAPNVPPGTLVYPVHPGDQPAADMRGGRNTRNHGYVANPNDPNGGGYYYERPQGQQYYRDDRGNRNNGNYNYRERGYDRHGYPGEYRTWQRGQYLPPEYRSRYYVVDDWRGHHLRRPPAGYYWVQSGGDYLLVAIATGIIASVILNQ